MRETRGGKSTELLRPLRDREGLQRSRRKTESHVSGGGGIKLGEKRCVGPPQNVHVRDDTEERTTESKVPSGVRWQRVPPVLVLLVFSLCPQPAESQVGD